MSTQKDTPDIDTLLQNSRWEERVAEARIKRENVLAAKNAAAEQATKQVIPRSQPATTKTVPRRLLVLMVLACIAISASAGAMVVWLFLR